MLARTRNFRDCVLRAIAIAIGEVFMPQLSVIVPTFREAENLAVLVPRLTRCFREAQIDGEIIVVDDNSPDDTVGVVAELSIANPVRLIVRKTDRGLSSAVIAGMKQAAGDVVLCMDADLSHPPEDVPHLFAAIKGASANAGERGADFVIGSRYVTGGSTEMGWGIGRWLNSKVATLLAWPLVSVGDPMAGFFALRRADFVRAAESLDPIGYKIALELLIKTNTKRVLEIPIQFKNRLHGESKLSLREQLNYVRHLGRLYRFRFPKLNRFLSFGIVGALGAIVDLFVFLALLRTGVSAWFAAGAAIWVAMTSNFELNRRLTFADRNQSWGRTYVAFCLSCLVGAFVNAGVRVGLMTFVAWFNANAWGAALGGILGGMLFNFSLCERFVFRGSRKRRDSHKASAASDAEAQSNNEFVAPEPKVVSGRKLSWLVRSLVALIVVLTAVLGRGHWAQLKKLSPRESLPETKRVDAEGTGSSKTTTMKALAQASLSGTRLNEATLKGVPATSSSLPLKSHRGFEFSDVDTDQRLRADARYLASDELEGRGTATNGIDKAADYIAREFGKAGLNTNPVGNGSFHEFTLLTREASATVSQVTLQDADSVLHGIARGRDFSSVLIPKPRQVAGGLTFAGFGISAPELEYDDFAELETRGRVLIVLRNEPSHVNWKSRATGDHATHALLRTKIRQAMQRGASAVVLCNSQVSLPKDLVDNAELVEADLSEVEAQIAELTGDLQRVHAEYANYRKRVERDRELIRELAIGSALVELLPVLDDIGRAREHDELEGAFRTVGEALEAATARLGLERFGEPNDPFDPSLHEALTSEDRDDVPEPTVIAVYQAGYRHAGRVLRPARVAVAGT